MSYDTSGAFGWDDEVQIETSEYTLLEPGEHDFTVVGFDRDSHSGSEKISACDVAVYTLDFDGVRVKYKLYLHKKFNWKITQFFQSIGLIDADAENGSKFVYPWESCIGCKGRAVTGLREYNGSQYNEISKCLVPEKSATSDFGTL